MAEAAPLKGYGVLITGGGTGIGRACAVDLASKGASVVICGRTEDRLKAVVSDLESRGLSAAHVVADVTVEDDVRRAVDITVAFAGSLKGVVANAGGGGDGTDVEGWDMCCHRGRSDDADGIIDQSGGSGDDQQGDKGNDLR